MEAGCLLDGKYELVRQIGQGPVGSVYEAEQRAFDRRVAVKVLAPGLAASPATRERFLTAARSASKLVHDNVATVHDAGMTEDKLTYMVTDYVPGENLGGFLEKKGALLPSLACELMLQILAGLAVAHEHGLLHRDLKLSNILVSHGANSQLLLKVTDFGMARAVHGYDDRPVSERLSLASPRFTSPEQALCQHVDHRADVYSAGAVLYEMVTGHQLFDGTSPLEFLARVVCGSFVSVREAKPSVPHGLAKIIEQSLDTGVDQRTQDVHVFASQLAQFVRRDPADPRRLIGRPIDPVLKIVDLKSAGAEASELPRSSEPSEVSQELLLSPTFPRSPGAPRMGSMRARTHGGKHRLLNALRPTSQARMAVLATLAGSAIGALLAWLSSAQ